MALTTDLSGLQDEKRTKTTKESINFFMNHLSEKELKVLHTLAKQLAENYSESYFEWKNKD